MVWRWRAGWKRERMSNASKSAENHLQPCNFSLSVRACSPSQAAYADTDTKVIIVVVFSICLACVCTNALVLGWTLASCSTTFAFCRRSSARRLGGCSNRWRVWTRVFGFLSLRLRLSLSMKAMARVEIAVWGTLLLLLERYRAGRWRRRSGERRRDRHDRCIVHRRSVKSTVCGPRCRWGRMAWIIGVFWPGGGAVVGISIIVTVRGSIESEWVGLASKSRLNRVLLLVLLLLWLLLVRVLPELVCTLSLKLGDGHGVSLWTIVVAGGGTNHGRRGRGWWWELSRVTCLLSCTGALLLRKYVHRCKRRCQVPIRFL